MMATGFDAPLTGASLTGPSRRGSWDLRLKEGDKGRKRTVESIQARLRQIDDRLADADALSRVHLAQERLDLQAELVAKNDSVDLQALEDAFIKAARGYGERKGLTYTAWRAAGVDANVLRRAGIPRTRA